MTAVHHSRENPHLYPWGSTHTPLLNNPSFWGTRPGGQAARLLKANPSEPPPRRWAPNWFLFRNLGRCSLEVARGTFQVVLTPGTRLGRFGNASQCFCTSQGGKVIPTSNYIPTYLTYLLMYVGMYSSRKCLTNQKEMLSIHPSI